MNPSHPDSRGPAAGAGSSDSRNSSMRSTENQGTALGGCLLAILPVASFLIQYSLSLHAGTLHAFFHHLTVMVVDWVFVPFNFFVVKVIDWGKGGKIFVIACISVALNALTHAYWQYNGLDFGHMITRNQIVLPAGWVHLAFSTIQMMLLVAFVFCRNLNASVIRTTTAFATAYFVVMGICGYMMHRGFIASDVVVFTSGIFFVLVYPSLAFEKSRSSGR